MYADLWDAGKAVLMGKTILINAYFHFKKRKDLK
jgi:hypothetical protein